MEYDEGGNLSYQPKVEYQPKGHAGRLLLVMGMVIMPLGLFVASGGIWAPARPYVDWFARTFATDSGD